MAIRREEFKRAFTNTDIPNWLCPRCNSGHLHLAEEKNVALLHAFHSRETVIMKQRESNPMEEEGYFSAMLRCSRSECGEHVAVCGQRFTDQDYDDKGES